MQVNRVMSSRWLSVGLLAVGLLSIAAAQATPILAFKQKEPELIRKAHDHSNLNACLWTVRLQLDRWVWEHALPMQLEEPNERYGVEPGNLWNDQPLLPPIRLERLTD